MTDTHLDQIRFNKPEIKEQTYNTNQPISIIKKQNIPCFLQTDKEALKNYIFANLFLYNSYEQISGLNDNFFAEKDTKEYRNNYVIDVIARICSDITKGYIPFSIKNRIYPIREKINVNK
jgi:hypothetical protein